MTAKSFTGGEKLQARLAEMAKNLETGHALSAGFMPGNTYPDGTPVAMVAGIQEFGAPGAGIPPRPFMRPAVAHNSSQWGDAIADQIVKQGYDGERTLRLVGEVVAADIQQAIVDVNEPELSQVTLMLRKMRGEGIQITGKSVGEAKRRVDAGESAEGDVNTKPLQDTNVLKTGIRCDVDGDLWVPKVSEVNP